ncbi:two-component system response regulator YesN [Paenibacillus sp. DS2015]|uniref:response regulator n=1 Tax=Paenibacillus sp. DS2015 TaxID=3373917 RepID=UPI003D23FDCC
MYKLILVDDESDVREGLLEEIPWEEHGFQVVDKAENGREAIDLIEKYLPDVVVTDIHMPFMNGLELSDWIKNKYPNTKIIILTGYDEFEYAQKAIKLQIDEYVLKPFSARELIDILLKVKQQLDEETADKENLQNLIQHYRKSLPVLRELFLSSLISRQVPSAEIREKSVSYGMNLAATAYMASVIRVDYRHLEYEAYNGDETSLTQGSLEVTEDRQLQLFAVLNIAEEMVQRYQWGKVFLHQDDVVMLAMLPDTQSDPSPQRTLEILEEIKQSVQKYLKLTVTIGVSSLIHSLEGVHQGYREAIQALDYRLMLGNNRVIWIDDVELRKDEYRQDALDYDEIKQQMLVRSIKLGTAQEVSDTVGSLFECLELEQLSVKDYQVYVLEILTSIMKVAKEFNVELEQIFGSNELPFAEIYKFNNLNEVKMWITVLSVKLMNTIFAGRQSSYNQLVESAKEYILLHYHESDISINKVCNHLHISTGYFSSIFKKEVKMTFVNYLMHHRMETAKVLLRSTDMKAFEIAEKVGFADPNYFSFCFRKKFGISPKEYRNNSDEGVAWGENRI